MKIKHFVAVENDSIKFFNEALWKKQLGQFNGRKGFITLSEERKKRTNDQNAWYWACVVGIPAALYGYYPEEMHDAYKMMFLRNHEDGKPETIKSTTALNTKEFSEYVERCRQWAAEQGFYIPEPEKWDK